MSGSSPEDRAPRLPSADESALLVIDMQHDFVHPNGAMAGFGFDVTDVAGIVPTIEKLLAVARTAGVPVIHTRMVNDVRLNAPSWTAFWGPPAVTIPGTKGAEFVAGLEPQPNEVVIDKTSYGGFAGTNLDTVLRAADRSTVVVIGTGPNICAGDTLHQAFALGYCVVAVEDALASFSRRGAAFNQQLKDVGLYIVTNHYGLVCRAEDLISSWGSEA